MTTHKEALEAAYLAGFNASGEGYNGEYPFGDKMQDPAENRVWKKDRDNYIKEALAQPEQVTTLDDLEQEIYENTRQFVSRDVMEWMLKRYYTTPPQRKPLTDELVLAGARALAKRHADSCGLDFDDVWKFYADEHKDDARAVIEAANGIKGEA